MVSSSSFFFFFSWPNLSRRTLDLYHTFTHGVALVRIYNAGLKLASRGSVKIQDAKNRQKFAIWAPSHNLSNCIFATKAHINNRKKVAKQQYLLHMFPHYGELRLTSG